MIKLENLTKRYGDFIAVNNVTLTVERGKLFGFLGPNGAGKTTTIKMMTGLLKPTSGRVLIGENDIEEQPVEAKSMIGFIPDRPFLYEKLTGIEFLRFMADIYQVERKETEKRALEFLELFELLGWKDELIEGYSHGMKQKLVISSALLHKPQFLIVDEPMVGLDPKSAKLIKELFKQMSRLGVTIFMSTHSLEVAQEMCDEIAIIQEGKVIALGTMKELQEMAASDDGRLESIFLKLTGDESMKELIEVLRTS